MATDELQIILFALEFIFIFFVFRFVSFCCVQVFTLNVMSWMRYLNGVNRLIIVKLVIILQESIKAWPQKYSTLFQVETPRNADYNSNNSNYNNTFEDKNKINVILLTVDFGFSYRNSICFVAKCLICSILVTRLRIIKK